MNNSELILLPGTDQQLKFFINNSGIKDKSILILGSNSEKIAQKLTSLGAKVSLILEDNDSLLNSRLILTENKDINLKLMEFTNTDFNDESFDSIYAQASISNSRRNKIIKEIKRILKPEGLFCVGEIVSLNKNVPSFVKDVWNASNIIPLDIYELNEFYTSKGFNIALERDLSKTLKDFYTGIQRQLNVQDDVMDEDERKSYKKLIKKINHESNVYLKLGGENFMGYKILILRKEVS